MIELDRKYVFHMPLYRYVDGKLELIEIDDVLDDLIGRLDDNGFKSAYIVKAKSFYRSRCFDELLIIVFTSSDEDAPGEIFREFFIDNNHIMMQEALAYECDGKLFIEKLDGF